AADGGPHAGGPSQLGGCHALGTTPIRCDTSGRRTSVVRAGVAAVRASHPFDDFRIGPAVAVVPVVRIEPRAGRIDSCSSGGIAGRELVRAERRMNGSSASFALV